MSYKTVTFTSENKFKGNAQPTVGFIQISRNPSNPEQTAQRHLFKSQTGVLAALEVNVMERLLPGKW